MASLQIRYQDQIRGILSCYDRVLLQGNLEGLGYASGMTNYLYEQGIRIFDYKKLALSWRDQVRDNAERVAREAGVAIEHVRRKGTRKESLVHERLKARGDEPGLVCILSAMESCRSYQPWHEKKTGRTFLRSASGKCLHYYFYFMDEQFGLCFVRVPTWSPFRLQFYFNGHNWLAARLREAGLDYQMLDNAFITLDDFERAQELADGFPVLELQMTLARYARQVCPVAAELGVGYRWTIMQVEYATDVVFGQRGDLAALYEHLVRTAVHTVKAEDVATFLGRKLTANYRDEVGNDLSRRIQGTRIKHSMGPASIKMYDKRGVILRIETTVNDVTFFKHYRTVYHRNGERSSKVCPMRKSICNLASELSGQMRACNRRYLEFLSGLDDPTVALKTLDRVTTSIQRAGHTYRGFNVFQPEDRELCQVLLRGEFNISGLRNRDIRRHLPDLSPGQVSHRLKRLRVHGLLKKVARSYKYHLTKLGRRILPLALQVRQRIALGALR